MCVQAWQEAGLDLKLRLYACMSTTANSGIIQVVDLVVILMAILMFMFMFMFMLMLMFITLPIMIPPKQSGGDSS